MLFNYGDNCGQLLFCGDLFAQGHVTPLTQSSFELLITGLINNSESAGSQGFAGVPEG